MPGIFLSGTAGSATAPGRMRFTWKTSRPAWIREQRMASSFQRRRPQPGSKGGHRAPPLVVALERKGQIVARYYLGTSGHLLAPHEGSSSFPAGFRAIEGAGTCGSFSIATGAGADACGQGKDIDILFSAEAIAERNAELAAKSVRESSTICSSSRSSRVRSSSRPT